MINLFLGFSLFATILVQGEALIQDARLDDSTITPVQETDFTENLIAYWDMEEASGNAIDLHDDNDLTDTNGIGTGTGKINDARDLESGSTQYFTIDDNTDLSTGDIDFTIGLWVNLETLGTARHIVTKGTNVSYAYVVWYNNSSTNFAFSVASATGSADLNAATFGTPSTGTWYYILAWHDSVNNLVGISVNGTADTASYTAGVRDDTGPFRIGSFSGGSVYYDGLVDEVGKWNRVFTEDQRAELYNGGDGLPYSSF